MAQVRPSIGGEDERYLELAIRTPTGERIHPSGMESAAVTFRLPERAGNVDVFPLRFHGGHRHEPNEET